MKRPRLPSERRALRLSAGAVFALSLLAAWDRWTLPPHRWDPFGCDLGPQLDALAVLAVGLTISALLWGAAVVADALTQRSADTP